MGLFSKKETKKEFNLPKLPELPNLSDHPNSFPELKKEEIHELPSFPTTSLGEKFSQDTIKNAVEGKKEEEFFEIEKPIIPTPNFLKESHEEIIAPLKPLKPSTKEEPLTRQNSMSISNEGEPVFIRIDKFEETRKIIKETKEGIEEIEELLNETKELKKKEEDELSLWEKEIQQMKQQIEKVDKDIFSKI